MRTLTVENRWLPHRVARVTYRVRAEKAFHWREFVRSPGLLRNPRTESWPPRDEYDETMVVAGFDHGPENPNMAASRPFQATTTLSGIDVSIESHLNWLRLSGGSTPNSIGPRRYLRG